MTWQRMMQIGETKENQKEGETVSGIEQIWNFYVCTEPANTGKGSCGVDTSLPFADVIYFYCIMLLCMLRFCSGQLKSETPNLC